MEYETLLTIQGYAKFSLMAIVFIVFYSYAYSLYKRDRTGEKDFEQYSNLVLDDAIESKPLENNREIKKLEKDDLNHDLELNKKIKKGDS